MDRGSALHGTTAAAVLLVLSGPAWAADLTLDAVPKPVMESVQTRFKDAKVVGAADEKTPEGNLIYEITLDEKGKNIDTSVNPDGSIFLIEKEVARKELPKEIAAAVEKEFPRARYRLCEQVITADKEGEKLAHYEVLLVTTAKQVRVVEIGLDGKILKIEKRAGLEEDE